MSILVDLIPWFSDNPENIFTRGLFSVLKHPAIKGGLQQLLAEKFGFDIPITELGLQVSQGPDGRPDLACVNAGHKVFFGEVKFGAPLTENQPCSYLNSLAPNGLLLFIAPIYRRPILWEELQENLHENGLLPNGVFVAAAPGTPYLIDVNGKHLALVTGRELLSALLAAAETVAEPRDLLCDIRQLQAFWDAHDTPDLPPMTREQLKGGELARLACGLAQLPYSIANGVDPAHAAGRALRGDNSGSTSVDRVYIGNFNGWIIYSPKNWREHGYSPIWFELGSDRVTDPRLWQAIRCVFAQRAHQPWDQPLHSVNYPFAITVPILIQPHSIEFQVLDYAVNQLHELAVEIEDFQQAA